MRDWSNHIAPHTLAMHNRVKKHTATKYVVVAIVSFAVGIAAYSGLDLLIRYWIGY